MSNKFDIYKFSFIGILIIVVALWFSRPIYDIFINMMSDYMVNERLGNILKSETHEYLQNETICTMGKIRDSKHIDIILQNMRNNSYTIMEASTALILIGKKAVPQIIKELKKYENDPLVKDIKLKANNSDLVKKLVSIEDKKIERIKISVDRLSEIITKYYKLYYYLTLIEILGNIKDERTLPVYSEILSDNASNDFLKIYSIIAIIQFGKSKYVKYLIPSLDSTNSIVKKVAIFGIGEFNSMDKNRPPIEKYWGSSEKQKFYEDIHSYSE